MPVCLAHQGLGYPQHLCRQAEHDTRLPKDNAALLC